MYLAPLSTFGLQKTLLKQLLDHIVVLAKPKRIILYGSRARGDYSPTSDIDLAIYCKDQFPIGLRLDLEESAGIYKIDIINMNSLTNEKLKKQSKKKALKFII